MAGCLREHPQGVVLSVRLQPRASRSAINGMLGEELKISVTAPPVDSAANQALVRLLADELGCSQGSVQIIRGAASRRKQVLLTGFSSEDAARKLGLA